MKNSIRFLWVAGVISWGAFRPCPAGAGTFTVLHSFSFASGFPATNSDGAYPHASLILSSNTLYGTTYQGGKPGDGTVFRVNTNGAAFTNLHSFTATAPGSGTNSGGFFPQAGLFLSGNTLYGTAYNGGREGGGTVFVLNTDGKDFASSYDFSLELFNDSLGVLTNSDGADPQGSVIVSGNLLYGTAQNGGSGGSGTVFRVTTNGLNFAPVHSFSATSGEDPGTNSDGAFPLDGLVLSSNTLYGTTEEGGSAGNGTVFRVNTDGSGFTNLHSFTALSGLEDNTNSDGINPSGGLILSGNILYGTATYGGSGGCGTIFAIHIDGSGFTNLHSFTASAGFPVTNSDGAFPLDGLVLSSNTLYGTAEDGGAAGSGTVFAINADGSGFTNLYGFTALSGPIPANTDGAYPSGGLLVSGQTLYGTAAQGGSEGSGTVFSLYLGPAISPSITTNPASQFVALGSNATLQVAAMGTNTLIYQWLFNGRTLANGSHVSGATTDALTLENFVAANAGSYEVIVTNAYGSATSAVAIVSILVPPHIITQPVAQILPTNGSATFSVKATGAPLTYQWFFNGNITDSTTNVLTIDPATAENVGTYSVVVSNAAYAVTSNPVQLTLVAEKTKPSVTITSPKANSRTNFPVLSGTASDTLGVEAVAYWVTNVNNGVITINSGQAMMTAVSGSVSDWSIFSASLLPGTNILTVQSSNYSGLASPVKSAAFFYQEPVLFTLMTNGTGTIAGVASIKGDPAPSDGTSLYVGESYTLTAKPGPGWWLTNWTTNGVVAGTNLSLSFIMEPGLVVSANFTTNLFIGMAARYDGIFYLSDSLGATEESSGLIENLQLKTNGIYSGKLYLAGATVALSGAFNRSGQTTETLGRIAAAGGDVTLQLNILYQSAPRQITGMVEGTGWVASNLNLYAAATNRNNASNYTMLLPQDPNLAGSTPPNYGYAFVTNTGSLVNLGGVLSDGTPFSRSEPINEQNEFPVYANLYSHPGLLLGVLSLSAGVFGDVPAGNLFWIKPAQKTGLYTNGFDTSLGVEGSPWTNSAAALANLFPIEAQLRLTAGGLSSDLVCNVILTSSNTLREINGSTNFTGGSINPANGQMTVTFINTSGKKVTASGAILQNTTLGGGFFSGTTNAGTITLLPPTP